MTKQKHRRLIMYGHVILKELVTSLAIRQIRMPTTKKSALATAKVIHEEWLKDERFLSAAYDSLGNITNGIRCLLDKDNQNITAQNREVGLTLIQGICQNPPEELSEDSRFLNIQEQLQEANGQ